MLIFLQRGAIIIPVVVFGSGSLNRKIEMKQNRQTIPKTNHNNYKKKTHMEFEYVRVKDLKKNIHRKQ